MPAQSEASCPTMATIVDVSGATYPKEYNGNAILPCEGEDLVPSFSAAYGNRGPLFWEHEGNAAVRIGKWKPARKYPEAWELYDGIVLNRDARPVRQHPERVRDITEQYKVWANCCGVIPREKILDLMKAEGGTAFWEEERQT